MAACLLQCLHLVAVIHHSSFEKFKFFNFLILFSLFILIQGINFVAYVHIFQLIFLHITNQNITQEMSWHNNTNHRVAPQIIYNQACDLYE